MSGVKSTVVVLGVLVFWVGLGVGCNDGGSGGGVPIGEGDTPTVDGHMSHSSIESGQIPLGDVLDHGRRLFGASFNTLDGAGRRASTGTGQPRSPEDPPRNVNRISGPDSNACVGCHALPRIGGGGDNVANVFVLAQAYPFVNFDGGAGDNFETLTLDTVGNERNTPSMFGAGYVELLAREMTMALHRLRADAIAAAARTNAPVVAQLVAKGVSFGRITAHPGGNVDAAMVEGVDADLILKPFHQKGVAVSLREFTNNAMNHHHGMQARERFGFGDADQDGTVDELTEGDITAATLFQATLATPGRVLPDHPNAIAAVARGEALFSATIANGGTGCANCHRTDLLLDDPVFTEPNPFNPPGNLRPVDVAQPVRVDLTTNGALPRLRREVTGRVRVPLYSDLKRHDMGPGLAEARVQAGVPVTQFITRKLWGFASEPPFMHHGRATTITEAILMHGGEALGSRGAFSRLPTPDKDAVIAFLKSLRILPAGESTTQVTGPYSGIIGEEPTVLAHVSQRDIDQGLIPEEALADLGKRLFAASFNTLDGAGRPESTGTGQPRPRRVAPENFNRISGPDSNSCRGCHNMPRIGGGGDNVANVFVLAQSYAHVNFDGGAGDNFENLDLDDVGNERNTPGMWGSGFIELLAREITVDLHAIRDAAVALARTQQRAVTAGLDSKGINFGRLTVQPSGALDTSEVDGVDADLIVKPFHQKGVVVSLREFTNNAMNHHHGMQSRERFGAGLDPDRDGRIDEMWQGDITAVTVFQAMMPVPGRVTSSDPSTAAAVRAGELSFQSIGCADCHRPFLVLKDPVFTEPNPYNPAGNLQLNQVPQPFAVDLTARGPGPRLSRESNGSVLVPAFTDLKRHDMGPGLAEPRIQSGIPGSEFITKKLWGFASEPPFMHHGRALTIREAIEMHGGDAQAARDAFMARSTNEQNCVIDFLKGLQVMPETTPVKAP